MAQIAFLKPELAQKHGVLSVAPGAVLMEALLEAGLPVASSCGGDGVCTKCRLRVQPDSAAAVSPIGALERGLLAKSSADPDERISCQTQVFGKVTVDADYW